MHTFTIFLLITSVLLSVGTCTSNDEWPHESRWCVAKRPLETPLDQPSKKPITGCKINLETARVKAILDEYGVKESAAGCVITLNTDGLKEVLATDDISPIKLDHALNLALYYNQEQMVKMLLEKRDPNVLNIDGNTVLYIAMQMGKVGLVRYLLGLGADPHIKNRSGYTSFEYAERYGTFEIQNLLRERALLASAQDSFSTPEQKKSYWHEASLQEKLKSALPAPPNYPPPLPPQSSSHRQFLPFSASDARSYESGFSYSPLFKSNVDVGWKDYRGYKDEGGDEEDYDEEEGSTEALPDDEEEEL